jgi:hypothetical protein
MNRPDLDEFAALWQDELDPVEQAQMEADARRARQRGRLLGYVDAALIGLILLGTVLGTMVSPHPLTIGLAVLLVVPTIWLSWKRRGLRQMAATLNTSDPAAFVASSIRNAASDLRRATLGVFLLPPFLVGAVVFRALLKGGGDFDQLLPGITAWAASPRGAVVLPIAALMMVRLAYSRRRLRTELSRLEVLQAEYQEETRREEGPD